MFSIQSSLSLYRTQMYSVMNDRKSTQIYPRYLVGRTWESSRRQDILRGTKWPCTSPTSHLLFLWVPLLLGGLFLHFLRGTPPSQHCSAPLLICSRSSSSWKPQEKYKLHFVQFVCSRRLRMLSDKGRLWLQIKAFVKHLSILEYYAKMRCWCVPPPFCRDF